MDQRSAALVAASGLAVLLASTSAEARVVITGAGQTRTVDCAGDTLLVSGAKAAWRSGLGGGAPAVQNAGSGNDIVKATP